MAPKRLQDIMMRYNRYDVNFVFTKGSKLYLADTLSRAHLQYIEGNQDEHARIMNIKTFGEIPDVQLEEIRQATALDTSKHVQHVEGQNWKWGEITQILGPNTYQVKGPDGGIYRRNRVHIRPTKVHHRRRNVSPIPAAQSIGESSQNSPQRTPAPNSPPLAGVEDMRIVPRIDHPPADAGEQASGTETIERPKRNIKPPIRFQDFVVSK